MRLILTLEYDGTPVPRLGGTARAADSGGRFTGGARGDVRLGREPRSRRPHRYGSACARPGRLGRRRGRAAARARRGGAQPASARRDHRLFGRRGACGTSMPAIRRARAAIATASSPGTTPSPFERRRSWWLPRPLDEDALAAAAAALVGEHDFRAFTPTQTTHKVFVRVVERAEWVRRGDHLDFEITANSYLRHMVRSLVGTMVEAPELGRGTARRVALARRPGATAPPWGLYLVSVAVLGRSRSRRARARARSPRPPPRRDGSGAAGRSAPASPAAALGLKTRSTRPLPSSAPLRHEKTTSPPSSSGGVERVAAEEVGAVVLARADERGVRELVAVEAERVLEDVPAAALALGRRDVRAGGERACRETGRARDRADAAEQRQSQAVGRRLVLGEPLREEDERPERDGAERVAVGHRRLDPVRARRRRHEWPPHDRELALCSHLVCAAVGTNVDAEPVILRLVLHRRSSAPRDRGPRYVGSTSRSGSPAARARARALSPSRRDVDQLRRAWSSPDGQNV